jgi:hypothetical protein
MIETANGGGGALAGGAAPVPALSAAVLPERFMSSSHRGIKKKLFIMASRELQKRPFSRPLPGDVDSKQSIRRGEVNRPKLGPIF